MAGYTKLFASIVHSTIWREPAHVRLVWVTMLAIADRDGVVEASVPGLADVARVTEAEAEQAIHQLSGPDIKSRSKALDGRRIVEVDGGWRLVNYEHYRDKMNADEQREKSAERMRRKRARDAARLRSVTPGDAESRAVTDVRQASPSPSPKSQAKEVRVESAGAPPQELLRGTDRPEIRKFEASFAAPLSPQWEYTTDHRLHAARLGVDVVHEDHQFRAHHKARKTRLHDWDAEFAKWLGNARPRNGGAPHPGTEHAAQDLEAAKREERSARRQQRERPLAALDFDAAKRKIAGGAK